MAEIFLCTSLSAMSFHGWLRLANHVHVSLIFTLKSSATVIGEQIWALMEAVMLPGVSGVERTRMPSCASAQWGSRESGGSTRDLETALPFWPQVFSGHSRNWPNLWFSDVPLSFSGFSLFFIQRPSLLIPRKRAVWWKKTE